MEILFFHSAKFSRDVLCFLILFSQTKSKNVIFSSAAAIFAAASFAIFYGNSVFPFSAAA